MGKPSNANIFFLIGSLLYIPPSVLDIIWAKEAYQAGMMNHTAANGVNIMNHQATQMNQNINQGVNIVNHQANVLNHTASNGVNVVILYKEAKLSSTKLDPVMGISWAMGCAGETGDWRPMALTIWSMAVCNSSCRAYMSRPRVSSLEHAMTLAM